MIVTQTQTKFSSADVQKQWEEAAAEVQSIIESGELSAKLSGAFQELEQRLEEDDKVQELLKDGINLPADELATNAQKLIDQVNKSGALEQLGAMSKEQMDGLMTQMGKFNTDFDVDRYSKQLGDGVGKYLMNPGALESAGMIQKGLSEKFASGALTSGDIFNNPASWVGGNKPGSLTEFLGNPLAQEQGFAESMNKNFSSMFKSGGILPSDDAEATSGMLAVSSKLGPSVANAWRNNNIGSIAGQLKDSVPNLETQADKLFQMGRHGAKILGGRQ